MEPTDDARDLYREIVAALDARDLEPDPSRAWGSERARLDDLWRRVEQELLPGARAAYRGRPTVAVPPGDLAGLLHELAALFAAASLRERAAAARDHAAAVVPADDPGRELIEGAGVDPDAAYAIVLARWRARHEDFDGHDDALRRAQRAARDPRMKAAIARMLDGPRPVKSAPSLVTINSFGTRLYGARDPRPDGSYVATRFATVAFVPLFPLDAWRVRPDGAAAYYFLAKEPLSRLARNYRRFVVVAALAYAVASPAHAWYTSPTRLAGRALVEADGYARTHPPEAAIARYRALAETYQRSAMPEAGRAAEAVVRLAVARVERPATVAQRAHIVEAVRAYAALPPLAQWGAASEAFAAAVMGWESELGESSEALALRETLLGAAERAGSFDDAGARRDAAARLEAARARRAGGEWPVEAVAHALRANGYVGEEQTWAWVEPLLRASSVTRFAERELLDWAAQARDADRRTLVRAAIDRAAVRAEAPARDEALRSNDRARLAAALALDAGDHEVALALARLDLDGDDDGARRRCLAALEALGPFGAVAPDVQAARAALMFATGRGAEADRLVEALAEQRLPAARRAQEEAHRAPGGAPGRVELDARAARYAPVFAAVVARAGWLLRDASGRSGAERQAQLERARAVLTSVAPERQASAEYQRMMGEVMRSLDRAHVTRGGATEGRAARAP